MANISRPFQIALAAVVLLAGVWLFALQGHSQSSSQGGSGSSPAASPQSPAAKSTTVYHGSAPGVAGLTGDIAKAKGAVATSQQNAHELESKSSAASSTGGTSAATSGPAASASSATATSHAASGSAGAAGSPPSKAPPAKPHSAKTSPSAAAIRQKQVEAALAAGNVVVVLFWNSKGADDVADAAAVRALSKGSGKTAVMVAKAGEVAAFGSITRGVQVFGTPTILVVGKRGKATVLTGLTDVFSLRQAVAQARHA